MARSTFHPARLFPRFHVSASNSSFVAQSRLCQKRYRGDRALDARLPETNISNFLHPPFRLSCSIHRVFPIDRGKQRGGEEIRV